MRPLAMRIVSGVMSFCLLMLLYGCNDAYTGNYNSFIIDTTDGVPASVETSPSQETTTTVPSDPTETTTSSTETTTTQPPTTEAPIVDQEPNWREPDQNGEPIMSEEEWEEYEQDDPQFPGNNDSPEGPGTEEVEDTLPSAPPPIIDNTTTTTSGTTTGSTTENPTPSTGTHPTNTTPGTTVTTGSTGNTTTTEPTTTTTTTPPTTTTRPSNGWYIEDGKTYYYYNGSPVTGWQTMGGIRYYFGSDGVLSSKIGIDVSTYQGVIDWQAVKNAGVDFVFIRAGFRGWGTAGDLRTDAYFKQNIEGATAAGLDCGVYFFSQAINTQEAVEEANYVLNLVKGYRLTYPIAFDTEYVSDPEARTNLANLTAQDRTDIAKAFCDTIRANGYYPMIYASKSWLVDEMYPAQLTGYDIWLAQYANEYTYPYDFRVWQYTDKGRVNGIKGNVDRNVGLFDYATYLKENGWNKL